jgi:hypothetical protein
MRSRHRHRAVSTVISTVLMTTLTLTLGVIVLFWASQTFGIQVGNAGIYFQNSSNAMLESIAIEDVWFSPSSPYNVVNVTVRNTGSIDIRIVAIYLNSTSQTTTSPSFGTTGISIPLGKAVTIKVTSTLSWSTTKVIYVSVATSRGTTARSYWSTGN